MQDLLSLWHEMMRSHKGMHPDFRIAENADVAITSNFTTLFDDSSAAFIVAEEEDKVVGMLVAQVRHGLPLCPLPLARLGLERYRPRSRPARRDARRPLRTRRTEAAPRAAKPRLPRAQRQSGRGRRGRTGLRKIRPLGIYG